MKKFYLLLLLFSCSLNALAFLDFKSPHLTQVQFESHSYINPNEFYPELAKVIWSRTPSGVYVSVGTERGFIGASVSHATHLLLIDHDPYVVMYNRLITALLVMSENGEDFRKKRSHLSFWLPLALEEHGSQLNESPETLKKYLQVLITKKLIPKEEINWTAKNASRDYWMWNLDVERPQVRYWENERLFKKLKKMAQEGKIQAELCNLNDEISVDTLASSLKKSGLKISTLDLSNTHRGLPTPYIHFSDLRTIVFSFKRSLLSQSHILFTWIKDSDFPLFEYMAFNPEDFHSIYSFNLADLRFENSILMKFFKGQARAQTKKYGGDLKDHLEKLIAKYRTKINLLRRRLDKMMGIPSTNDSI